MALTAFAARSKQRFLAGPGAAEQSSFVYVGNAAGDLDTIVSAITLAYVRNAEADPDGPLHVPVIPFVRSDFRLRQDASLLFTHCGFAIDGEGAPSDLLFWDEISDELAAAWRAARLGIVLTDHNSLTPAVGAALGDNVIGVVDHHQDEKRHLETCEGPHRNIDTAAGSACSLVVLEARETGSGTALDACVALLLLGTVAADCRGFDPAQRRFDWADVEAAAWLLARLGVEVPPAGPAAREAAAVDAAVPALRATELPPMAAVGRRRPPVSGEASDPDDKVEDRGWVLTPHGHTLALLGRQLLEARYDVSALSAADLMRLDYKQAASGGLSVGVAAIFAPLSDFVRRCGGAQGLAAVLAGVAAAKGVDLIVAMTASEAESDGGRKGVALMPAAGSATAPAAASALQAALQTVPAGLPEALATQPLFVSQRVASDGFGLGFACVEGAPAGSGLVTSLLAPQITRKTMLPTILHFLKQPPAAAL